MLPRVICALVPTLADQYAWGARDGWWALISWIERTVVDGQPADARHTAWVPAASLTASAYATGQTYALLPRLILPPDPEHWPALRLRHAAPLTHHGRLVRPRPSAPGIGSAYG